MLIHQLLNMWQELPPLLVFLSIKQLFLAPAGKGAAMAADINKGPVSKIIVVESDAFVSNGVAAVADVLAQIIAAQSPAAVLIASHAFGKEVAARTAIKSGSGIITDAVDQTDQASARGRDEFRPRPCDRLC